MRAQSAALSDKSDRSDRPDRSALKLTRDEMQRLATVEFSAFVSADPVMRDLQESASHDPAETLVLWEMLGVCATRIGRLPVRPLTAAKWALLWSLDIRSADLFLGILSEPDLRKLDCEVTSLPVRYAGYAAATGLSPEEVEEEIRQVRALAFLPLSRLPADSPSGEPEFDAVWLAAACGIAARGANVRFEEALHELPLSVVCAFYVGERMRNTPHPETIRRRTGKEAQRKIDQRFDELCREFLAQTESKDILPKEIRAEYKDPRIHGPQDGSRDEAKQHQKNDSDTADR